MIADNAHSLRSIAKHVRPLLIDQRSRHPNSDLRSRRRLAVVVADVGVSAVVEMFLFLGVLSSLWCCVARGSVAVGLRRRWTAGAVGRAHALVVEVPGWWATRVAVEQELGRRGWRIALSPTDADFTDGIVSPLR